MLTRIVGVVLLALLVGASEARAERVSVTTAKGAVVVVVTSAKGVVVAGKVTARVVKTSTAVPKVTWRGLKWVAAHA